MRIDERRDEREAGCFDDAVSVRLEALADLRDHPAVDADVQRRVDALDGIDDARTAHNHVVVSLPAGEHQATPTAVSTATGPAVSRSYSTAIRTTSPARTCSTTSETSESATRGVDLDAAVHRTGMHDALPLAKPHRGDAPLRRVLAQRRHEVRAREHPLTLHPQDVHNVRIADRGDVVGDRRDALRDERRRPDEHGVRTDEFERLHQ